MNNLTFIHEYTEKMEKIQSNILEFLKGNQNKDIIFQNLQEYLEEKKILENQQETQDILQIILNIANNCHRSVDFFVKIDRVLNLLKIQLEKIPKIQLFNIIKSSKHILLFLFKEKILIPDESIYSIITKSTFKDQKYPEFFYLEFQTFHSKEKMIQHDFELFEQKRKIGENDSYICKLIQNDSIDDFIVYSTQTNLNFSRAIIEPSIYETNSFLLKKKKITLIEYAAFYGSIQIFKYLQMNKVELTPSLWLYAIHGNNAELIHLLEENHIKPDDETYKQCLKESIKCHHINISNYIKSNLIENEPVKEAIYSLHYHNFIQLNCNSINLNEPLFFYYLCKYNYISVVQFLLQNNDFDINTKITIINTILFDIVFYYIF